MIDIENEIFNLVATKVREKFAGIFISGEYVRTPPSFPCVSLVEMDNSINIATQTSSCNENHARLMYELDIYSNKQKGKKSECKAIAKYIDEILTSIGLTRTMLQPVPNMDDATIYRMKGRYTGIVSNDKIIYGR